MDCRILRDGVKGKGLSLCISELAVYIYGKTKKGRSLDTKART